MFGKMVARYYLAIILGLLMGTISAIFLRTSIPIVQAVDCIGDLSNHRIDTIPTGSDGNKHVKFAFVDSSGNPTVPPPDVANAIGLAVSRWNNQSGTTKVVFEEVGLGQASDAHIQFKPSDNVSKTGICAGYRVSSDRIFYSPGFEQAAQSSLLDAATVITHELGHFLGLDDAGVNPNPPTIMNNPPSTAQTCLQAATSVPTTSVLASDAAKVVNCIQQAEAQQPVIGQSYNYDEPQGEDCYARYLVTDYYFCDSKGCSYWYSDWQFLGVVCYQS